MENEDFEDRTSTADIDPPADPKPAGRAIHDKLLTLLAMVAFSVIIIAVQLLSANKVDADEFWRSFYSLAGMYAAGGSIAGLKAWLNRRAN